MDMDKLINAVTEEVMRKVKVFQEQIDENSRRILVAASKESESYKSISNKIDSFPGEIDSLENMNEELDCYENIILCGLDNRELANLALGVQCGQKEQIAIKGIFKGKRILLVEEGIEYRRYHNTSNKMFYSMYMEYERKVISYGITLVREENIFKAINMQNVCTTCLCSCALELQNEVNNESDIKNQVHSLEETNITDFTDKKLVSETDLRIMLKNGNKTMRIRRRTVLTPLAKDFIRMNHIKVNRIE